MEYFTAVDMNELVIYNYMNEFQHHSVELWGKNNSQKIHAVRFHLY